MASNQTILLELLPHGLVASRKWILAQGIPVHRLDNWLRSKKIRSVTRGVFCQPGVVLTWQGVVASLQRMSEGLVYVGGLSALHEAGLGHYLGRNNKIHIYAEEAKPRWLDRLELNVEFIWHHRAVLWESSLCEDNQTLRAVAWREGLPNYFVASPEQAFMEVLTGLPSKISFEYVDQLAQGLGNASPTRIDVFT